MKYQIKTFSIALILSIVLLSLMKSDSTVKAEPPQRFAADTGLITLENRDQVLRITAVGYGPNSELYLSFRRMGYEPFDQGGCSSGVCRLVVTSQTTSDPIALMPGEAFFFDIPAEIGYKAVRGMVLSNSRDVKVNALIINRQTGEVVAFSDLQYELQ